MTTVNSTKIADLPTSAAAERADQACPICAGSGKHKMKWRLGYHLWHCKACGLLFSTPLPTDSELKAFYEGFLYRQTNDNARNRIIEGKKLELKRRFNLDSHTGEKLSFLDYGGGTGPTFEAALQLGLDAYFYDLDPQSIQYVTERMGGDTSRIITDPEDCHGRRFDLILCDNVIEHVPQPWNLMTRLANLLTPNGQLVIKTPNARDMQHWFYPVLSVGYWVRSAARHDSLAKAWSMWWSRIWPIDPPRHIYAFSEASLQKLAARAGFKKYATKYYRIPIWEYSLAKVIRSRPPGLSGLFKTLVAAVMLPIESLFRLAQPPLLACGLISHGGVSLTLNKADQA